VADGIVTWRDCTPTYNRAINDSRKIGRKEGQIEGLRLAVAKLLKWAAEAREVGDEFEGKCLEEAAVHLGLHANAMEVEGKEP